jgi:hypothetical protein
MNAIRECAISHVPTIGIVDSNVDPRVVMYPIPANDESTRTAEMVAGVLSIAGREGVELFDKTLKAGSEAAKRREAERTQRKAQNHQFMSELSTTASSDESAAQKEREEQDIFDQVEEYLMTGWQYGDPLRIQAQHSDSEDIAEELNSISTEDDAAQPDDVSLLGSSTPHEPVSDISEADIDLHDGVEPVKLQDEQRDKGASLESPDGRS